MVKRKKLENVTSLGIVFGTFAPLHVGHIDIINQAKRHNDGVLTLMMLAAPVISAPITMVSMNQYNHPSENPAQWPNPCSAYTANDPEFGRAAAISPSIFIIINTTMLANT